MLVLTRRVNESVLLPGLGITFRVLSIKGTKIRIGIEAPPEVAILRDELLPLVQPVLLPAAAPV